MRGGTTQERIIYWFFYDKIPVTKLLIVSNALTFVALGILKSGAAPLLLLTYFSGSVIRMPWSLFTYPIIGVCCNIINLLFSCYWLWIAGGSLERSWGSRRFAGFFFVMSAISAFALLVGGMLSNAQTSAAGLWLPLAVVTIAFAMLNPEQQILFMFILPLKLKYLALLDVAIVFYSYTRDYNPVVGVFALTGCALAYWYVRKGAYVFPRPSHHREPKVIHLYRRKSLLQRLNPLWWYKEYKDRKRLKDFLERSGPDNRW